VRAARWAIGRSREVARRLVAAPTALGSFAPPVSRDPVLLRAPVSASPRSLRLLPFSAALALAGVLAAPPAHADVSSWASAMAGPTIIDDGIDKRSVPSLELETGIGTPPSSFLAVGGLFHLETHFGQGTDLGLLARVATRGFVLGDWGAALDLGGYERFWGRRSAGGLGKLVLGAPWGLQLAAGGGMGTNDAKHYGVWLGIDFARLTIFRTTGETWFPNPYPAYRKPE